MTPQPPNPDAAPSPVPEAEAASSGNISLDLGRTLLNSLAEFKLTPPFNPTELGRLGKYRIQKELGRGGMGAVFLAFDERLQRKVALKVMLPDAAADRGAKERFLREARAAAQISSDYVVNIFEADEIDGIPYIALQFLQGCPLDDFLKRHGNPSLPQIIKIGQEAALGLEAAHQLGLIHRDIKPANLWLEAPQGRVKILDFGLARQQDDNVQLTRKGIVVGTPAFMSPEQARNQHLDHRSDLFSLGGVLYRLCTGQLPFAGDSTIALLTALAVDEPTPVRQLNPSVPEPLANLVHRLLAKDPARRPPTAKAVADELGSLFNSWQSQQQMSQLPVAYMPMAIAPQQEANPFEAITELGSATSESATTTGTDEPLRRKPFPTMLVASLLFALLVVAGAVFMLTKKPSTEVVNKNPDPTPPPPPRKIDTPKNTDLPPIVMDADRIATQWVLDIGGAVRISTFASVFNSSTLLPKEPFHLLEVQLADNKQLNDEGLTKFKDCQHLKTLNVHDTKVGDDGVRNLMECKSLTYLTLLNTRVTDQGLKYLEANPRFVYLDVRGGVSDEAVKALATAMPHCKIVWNKGIIEPKKSRDRIAAEFALSAGASVKFTDGRGVTKLEHLPNGDWQLVEVFASGNQAFTDDALANFQGCDGMQRFILISTPVTGTGFRHLTNCKQISEIALMNSRLVDAGLVHLKEFPNLSLLTLVNTQVTEDGLQHLKECKNLTYLALGHLKLTGPGLLCFKDCKKLTFLTIDHNNLTDASLEQLKPFENLTFLGLDANPIGNAGLVHLKNFKKLTTLSLRETRVTDAGLVHLHGLKALTSIDLVNSQVTATGVAALKKELPNCEIKWDEPKK